VRTEIAAGLGFEPLPEAHAEAYWNLVERSRAHLEPWLPWVLHVRDIGASALASRP